jgi:conjugal transfer pilus assembly protein TraB
VKLSNAYTAWISQAFKRLSPKQRQYAMLVALFGGGVGALWLVLLFSMRNEPSRPASTSTSAPKTVTNLGVMPPGQQVNPVDQWVGTAGQKLAQYENEREEQTRLNKDRQAFEARTMQRFSELEQRLMAQTQAQAQVQSTAPPVGLPPALSLPVPASTPSAPGTTPIAPPLPQQPGAYPPGQPLSPTGLPPVSIQSPVPPMMNRVSLRGASAPINPGLDATTGAAGTPAASNTQSQARHISSFLPVSFTRGTLLGGLDAPTGGQSQNNPQPVLIRLSDNSVLPNHLRGQYKDCFVIAAGYGDISSERAYLRTENLSCVHPSGDALEVRIQGSIFGEDGKVGMRGRLVTKQGQILANALLAGVVGGIGQGVSTSSSSYSTSVLGTVSNASGSDALRGGVGAGVGRALDRLAQYYIKLAENTFPVIEVDAGREIDVVITQGVRIDLPQSDRQSSSHLTQFDSPRAGREPADHYLEKSDDEQY